jgi:hypothetical protein
VRDRAEAEHDNIKLAGLRRQQRTRDWLPKRITAVLKKGAELRKRAGASRAR